MIVAYLAIALLLVATGYSAIVSFRSTEGKARSWTFPDRAGRPARILVGVFTLIFLTGAGLWLLTSIRTSTRPSSRLLIPDGYTGWVRIGFEVKSTSSLPMEGNEYIVKIPVEGKLQTSSPEQYGWARDKYYYYSAEGVHPLDDSGPAQLIWGKINGEESGATGERKYEEFFVGTEQQFKDQGNEEHKARDR
jgi:hypothetical protein